MREQEEARRLRALGETVPAIALQLGVSKSSVSLWVRDVVIVGPRPPRVRGAGGPNALSRRRTAEVERLLAEGRERIGRLTEQEFLVAGTALYAGEGSKRDGDVVFTNTSGPMVAFFCAWLRRFFDVDESKLRLRLYLHEGLDLDAALDHWCRITGVPRAQVLKPYRARPDRSIRRTKHVYGCVGVAYRSASLHRAVIGLVAGLLSSDAIPG